MAKVLRRLSYKKSANTEEKPKRSLLPDTPIYIYSQNASFTKK